MDADRFDVLTRTLTTSRSRRLTLRGLSAGLLGALGLAWEETTVRAKDKKRGGGKAKKKGKVKAKCKAPCGVCGQCKDGKCQSKPNGTPCGETGTCQQGTCQCPPGQRYCVNGAACAECCLDKDCPSECSWCSGYPDGRCSVAKKDVCQGDPACVKPICEDRYTHRAWVCRNTCCDEFAGEERCGTVCCNSLVGETCCDGTFCCTADETCTDGRCVLNCPNGRPRCGGECCTDNQECDEHQCVLKQCTAAPPQCSPCWEPRCVNPGADPANQYQCDWTCQGRETCHDGSCAICAPNETQCYVGAIDDYDCCGSTRTCMSPCGCCFSHQICCPSGDCCNPGKCVPGGGCSL